MANGAGRWCAAVAPAPPAAAPKWTVGEVNKMTVPKLKAALTELGLATDGLKKVLKERLLGALAGGDDGDDGAAPAAPEPEPAPAPMDVEADAARPAADALTAAEVEKMKVYDLKLALEARGLSTEGLKKVLKARLLAALG